MLQIKKLAFLVILASLILAACQPAAPAEPAEPAEAEGEQSEWSLDCAPNCEYSDLVVGFEPGYRTSWQTAVGGAPPIIVEDNLRKWTGDHMCDAPCVPGIFLMNRESQVPNPDVRDIAPSVLRCFGAAQPADMEGKPLFD